MKHIKDYMRLQQHKKRLEQVSYSDCKVFVPPIRFGKVVKVYDGDTFTIAFVWEGKVYRHTIRVHGIDCPEIRSDDPNEKKLAIFAREKIRTLIYNKMVRVECLKYDKYGRVLAHVFVDDEDVSEYLIRHKLAVFYDGTTKPNTDWNTLYYSNK